MEGGSRGAPVFEQALVQIVDIGGSDVSGIRLRSM